MLSIHPFDRRLVSRRDRRMVAEQPSALAATLPPFIHGSTSFATVHQGTAAIQVPSLSRFSVDAQANETTHLPWLASVQLRFLATRFPGVQLPVPSPLKYFMHEVRDEGVRAPFQVQVSEPEHRSTIEKGMFIMQTSATLQAAAQLESAAPTRPVNKRSWHETLSLLCSRTTVVGRDTRPTDRSLFCFSLMRVTL
jgi:hypothetical protein